MKDSVARPARTTGQAGVGLILAQFVDAWIFDMSDLQFGSLVALLTVAIGFVQNLVEDNLGKAVFRDVPAKEVPVVDRNENGFTTAEIVLLVFGIIGAVLVLLAVTGNLKG